MRLDQYKKQRHPGGDEYFNYPTPFALRVWFYVRAIGKSRHGASFRLTHRNEDGFLLHFVKSGALWLRIGDNRHVIRRGEVCLFDLANEVSYGTEGNRVAELCWVWFHSKDMPLVFRELHADQDPVFRGFDASRMESLSQELLQLIQQQPAGHEVKSSGLLTLILGELQASRSTLPTWLVAPTDAASLSAPIRRAMDYVTRFYEIPLPVKRLADRAARQSLYHFSRQFHREVGVSPSAYVKQFRVEQAKRLLQSTARPVGEIARCVGFADEAYFSRVFTRLAGLSPRQYRQKHQRAKS